MKKYFLPIIICLVIFSLSFILLSSYKRTPQNVKLEIEAIIPSEDVFEVFYQIDGMENFSKKQCVKTIITGSDQSQKISFIIPIEKLIKKLRIDVGKNKNSKPMVLKSVKLLSLKKSVKFSLNDDFIPAYSGDVDPLFRSY